MPLHSLHAHDLIGFIPGQLAAAGDDSRPLFLQLLPHLVDRHAGGRRGKGSISSFYSLLRLLIAADGRGHSGRGATTPTSRDRGDRRGGTRRRRRDYEG